MLIMTLPVVVSIMLAWQRDEGLGSSDIRRPGACFARAGNLCWGTGKNMPHLQVLLGSMGQCYP